MDSNIQELETKISRELKVLDGANKMLQVANEETQQLCMVNIQESHCRLVYLQTELKKLLSKNPTYKVNQSVLEPPQLSISQPQVVKTTRSSVLASFLDKFNLSKSSTANNSNTAPHTFPIPETSIDFLKFGNTITAEQVKFRLRNVKVKLDLERKVNSGTGNLLAALASVPANAQNANAKMKTELEGKISEANDKISILTKSEHNYADLDFEGSEQKEDELLISDNRDRRTGRVFLRLSEAMNLSNRKSIKEDMIAIIKIDGSTKHISKPSKSVWDESINIQVDRALELEIVITDKEKGSILGFVWMKLADLQQHLDKKYENVERSIKTMDEVWLDLEPSGQVCLRLDFVGINKNGTQVQKDRVFRRDAVQKIYPRNGHRFVAQQFYQVLQCSVCNEFMGKADYQCQSCRYSVHAKCYQRVITKCIDLNSPEYSKLSKEEQNTGQLLKYNIPHRWDPITNMGPSWCGHCGYMIAPGKKIHRCSECNKNSHKECSALIPAFCGLAPHMADQLVAAFEDHERKMHQKELEEAEKDKSIDKPNVENQFSFKELGSILDKVLPDSMKKTDSLHAQAKAKDPSLVLLEDFSLHSVLGRGAFGKVMLVSENTTGSYYALKALKKEFIIKNDDINSIKLEKSVFQISSASRHPFLVNLHSCFHSDTRVYFVMEYISGGDLMTHIQEKRRFSQIRTKFYACEVLLALEYLHMNKIIYRDLKLDNILLCADGHIKIADYGICKSNIGYGDLTATFCGTPDYMAVEVLLSKKYGLAADWWSFGILIYVMLIGKYPYHGEDENEILEAILADQIEYPPNMPPATLSLIQNLLNKNPARRLGAGVSDAEEVRRHSYFQGVDWNAILQKKVQPPYVPTIADPQDVSNFDKTFTVEDPVLTPMNTRLTELEQSEFIDFTFTSEWAVKTRLA